MKMQAILAGVRDGSQHLVYRDSRWLLSAAVITTASRVILALLRVIEIARSACTNGQHFGL